MRTAQLRSFTALLLLLLVTLSHTTATADRVVAGVHHRGASALAATLVPHLSAAEGGHLAASAPLDDAALPMLPARHAAAVDAVVDVLLAGGMPHGDQLQRAGLRLHEDQTRLMTTAPFAEEDLLVGELPDWVKSARDSIVSTASEVSDSVSDAASDLSDSIGDGLDYAQKAISGVSQDFIDDVEFAANFDLAQWFKVDGSVTAPGIIGAILFGFINGFLMGLGEMVRSGFQKQTGICAQLAGEALLKIDRAAASLFHSISEFFVKMVNSAARGSESRVDLAKNAIMTAFKTVSTMLEAAWSYVSGCPLFKELVLPLLILVVIAVALTILCVLVPGAGWWVKLVGFVLTIVFGIPFLIKTVKKFYKAAKQCSTETCAASSIYSMIEAALEVVGVFLNAIILSGADYILKSAKAPAFMSVVSKSRLLGIFKLKMDGSIMTMFTKVNKAFKLKKAGKTVAAKQELDAAVVSAKSTEAAAVSEAEGTDAIIKAAADASPN